MTVCVAALSEDGSCVVAASDQMMSTDDNQTKRLKMHHMTNQVFAMIAGDVNLHTELLAEVRSTIRATIDQPDIHTVKNVADAYASAYIDAKRRRAESTFLSPLGLTFDTFIGQQRSLEEKIAADITRQIIHFPMPPCAAMFVGIDNSYGFTCAHIYTVQDGQISCHNDTGFAAIGVGKYQAMSSLMFSGHRSSLNMDAVVYMTLAAKKRAEVAPGVGKETDIAFVSVAENRYILLKDQILDRLTAIYDSAELAHTQVNESAIGDCHDYLDTFRTPTIRPEPEHRVELSGTAPAADTTGHFVDGTTPGASSSASSVQHDAGSGSQEEGRGG